MTRTVSVCLPDADYLAVIERARASSMAPDEFILSALKVAVSAPAGEVVLPRSRSKPSRRFSRPTPSTERSWLAFKVGITKNQEAILDLLRSGWRYRAEAILEKTNAHRPEADWPSVTTIRVQIHGLRRRLVPHGVAIASGQDGYWIEPQFIDVLTRIEQEA